VLTWFKYADSLPLGISFFTLQQVGFLIDTYQGMIPRQRFLDFSLLVCFFPKLTIGPIVGSREFLVQAGDRTRKAPVAGNILEGSLRFSIGFAKKVVIANHFGNWSDIGFMQSARLSCTEAWVTALSYAFYLYFDFSGYCDMAIGAAKVLNFSLPENFDSPFKATDLIAFWQRWHISLTSCLTSYVYTPIVLAMKKRSFAKSLAAVMITMTVVGIWHGPTWLFLFFGVLHGAGLGINHVWKRRRLRMPIALAWLLTFQFVVVSLLFFRAPDWNTAGQILSRMYLPVGNAIWDLRHLELWPPSLWCLAAALIGCTRLQSSRELLAVLEKPAYLRIPFYLLLYYSVFLFGAFHRITYVYFRF
jgi:alginate O-acetyltransferase complex protein AlgI